MNTLRVEGQSMISCFSHVALLVPSVEASAQFLSARGINSQKAETFESEGTKEVYVGSYQDHSGLLLLLEAISEGPYQRAMKKRGPGLHHFALDVLNLDHFISQAQRAGWNLHPISSQTQAYGTAWLFFKDLPLIEVQQNKNLSLKPVNVSKIEFDFSTHHKVLFDAVGLTDLISPSRELWLTVSDQRCSLIEIKC